MDKGDLQGLNCKRMRKFASFRTIRITLAFAVSLWMAGAGCLLGCESLAMGSTHVVQNEGSSAPVVSGESCAAHQKHTARAKVAETVAPAPIAHHSNHAGRTINTSANLRETPDLRHATRQHVVTRTCKAAPSSMMECPLAVNAEAALSKASTDNAKIAPVLTTASRPLQSALEQTSALVRPPRLPNRGHTYLQCCVFLI